jgi:MprA protease rhombosortase-interaction domain-containing protein
VTDAERSGRRRRLLKSLGVGIGAFLLFGLVTGLLPNPIYVRMVERTPADYVFLVATAAFAAAFVYQRSLTDDPIGDRFAAGGIVGGFLAFGCPICNAVLLALFSSSALMTYFDPLRPLLGAVSVLLFAGLLSYQRRRCTRC